MPALHMVTIRIEAAWVLRVLRRLWLFYEGEMPSLAVYRSNFERLF